MTAPQMAVSCATCMEQLGSHVILGILDIDSEYLEKSAALRFEHDALWHPRSDEEVAVKVDEWSRSDAGAAILAMEGEVTIKFSENLAREEAGVVKGENTIFLNPVLREVMLNAAIENPSIKVVDE